MAAFEFIKELELYDTFMDAKTFMLPLWQPLDEYERVARNRPHPGIAPELPKVTDGTLASLIQEAPKRIIQQIPTGKVQAPDPWLRVVGDYIFEHEIIQNANQQAALIQKCWAMTSKALTYGSQPAFVQFVNRGDYFGTDFTLPYIKDVLLEPGKLSDRDSNVIFLRTWWSKNQIDAVIAKEKGLAAAAVSRKDEQAYQTGWDLKKLAKLRDLSGQKDQLSMTPNERGKQLNHGFIEIVHALQRGPQARFYSFSPQLDATDNVVRRKTNKDPRGIIPLHFMYANVDLSNPLGRGAVEISGGMQNLLDSEVQSYQYMRALLMNPPIEIRGDVASSILKYAPAAQWRLGTDPNASITPVKLATESLTSFPTNYGMIKSQILSLNSSPDNTVSASATGGANSKTPQGVNANEQHLGISDNYLRRQFESQFEEIGNTLLNLWFAERKGVQELTLTPSAAQELKLIDPALVNAKNQVRVDYDSETPKLSFKVDPTTSGVGDKQEQIADLQELLQSTAQNPYIPYLLQAEGKELHVGEVYVQLFERYGIQGIDKIITDIEKDPQTGQPVKAPQVMTPFFDKPHLTAVYKDLPPKAQMQLLANGGVTVEENDVLQPNIDQIAGGRMQNPVQPAYVDPQSGQIISGHPPEGQPYVDPSTGQPVQGQTPPMSEHPLIQLLSTLQIKFNDLPLDSQHDLLNELGLPTASPTTPANTRLQIEASNAATNVARLQHDTNVAGQQAAQAGATHQLATQTAQPAQAPPAPQSKSQTPPLDATDQYLVQELQKRGYNEAQIGTALAMMKAGRSNAEILQALQGQ